MTASALSPRYKEWISPTPGPRFTTSTPRLGTIMGYADDAVSVRTSTEWRLGGELGAVLNKVCQRGEHPTLVMVLLHDENNATATADEERQLVIALYVVLGGSAPRAIVARESTIQTMVDAVIIGRPSNLPEQSDMVIAVPNGPVQSPIRWAGGRKGVLVVSAVPGDAFRMIWNDRTDQATSSASE